MGKVNANQSEHFMTIQETVRKSGFGGVDVNTNVALLRRYVVIERGLMRALAGWFLRVPAFEAKYAVAHHIWHQAEHVNWLRERLVEVRGGRVEASVEPAVAAAVGEMVNAPDPASFIDGTYSVVISRLVDCYRDHLAACDVAANAYEIRLLRRLIASHEEQLAWAETQHPGDPEWREHLRGMFGIAGGISGLEESKPYQSKQTRPRFERPQTITFDDRIHVGALTAYDQRKDADARTAVIEDFKVFFNEFYAAALLASVLYDADPASVPWEFFYDFAHHFWDEVRHSQFGYLRLTELGVKPTTVNPVLFEQSQSLPVLHRIAYLTIGLEVYFMPRKRPRVKAYLDRGDPRSQFFADHDWSDEANHVKYGKKWIEFLLEDDLRTEEDVLAEVRQHLERVSGQTGVQIAAPF